jgi:hypothetical protein
MTAILITLLAFALLVAGLVAVHLANPYARATRLLNQPVTLISSHVGANTPSAIQLANGWTLVAMHHGHQHFTLQIVRGEQLLAECSVYEDGAKAYGSQSWLAWNYGPSMATAYRKAYRNAALAA